MSVELSQAPPAAAIPRAEWLRLARRAKLLSWASIAYMGAEGAVAVIAGFIAASPSLIGFGIDSAIEGVASLIIVWRFTGARLLSEQAERRAQVLVAIQFFMLAPYVAYESLDSLLAVEPPEPSWVGIGSRLRCRLPPRPRRTVASTAVGSPPTGSVAARTTRAGPTCANGRGPATSQSSSSRRGCRGGSR